MRILYIEDNPANISLLQRIARMGGHDVLYYNDGEVALSNFERDNPDLILVDLQLAGVLGGLDVVRKLRADGVKLPIVAVTAYAMVGDKERCLEAGCDSYLAKPLPVAELVEIVQKYQLNTKANEAKPAETPAASPAAVPATASLPPMREDSTVSDRSHLLRETAPLVDNSKTAAAEPKAEPAKAAETPAASAAPAKPEAAPKPAEKPVQVGGVTKPLGELPPAPKVDTTPLGAAPAPKTGTTPLGSVPPASPPAPKVDAPAASTPTAKPGTAPLGNTPSTPTPKADTPPANNPSSTPPSPSMKDTEPVDSMPSVTTPKTETPTDKPAASNGEVKFSPIPQKAENGKKE